MENVDDDVGVIRDDPLAGRKSVHGHRHDVVIDLQGIAQFPGNRLQMRLGSSRANDEVIGEARDSLEIEDDDVFRLFVVRESGAGFG
jgi:hypothetical protein